MPEDPPTQATPPSQMTPRSLTAAVVLIWLQAAALVALGVIVVVKVFTGHPNSVAGALLTALWPLLGALVLALCARAVARLQAAARTPIVVIELLALPISYTLAFGAHRPEYGAPMLISALAVLYLLFTPGTRAALDQERSF
jgi:hypothetical protein